MPESLEGGLRVQAPVEDDDIKKRLKVSFAKYLRYIMKRALKKKQLSKSLVADLTADDERGAFVKATEGLLPQEAEQLASYILQKSVSISLLAKKFAGGEHRMQNTDELNKNLDTALDGLEKSLGLEPEELNKSMGSDDDDTDPAADNYQADGSTDDSDENDGNDGGAVEKSFADEFASKDESIEKALEVSDFLETLVGAVGEAIDGFSDTLTKSLNDSRGVQTNMAKVVVATGTLMKSLFSEVSELRNENKAQGDLIKSLLAEVETLAGQPVGRKSVVNNRDLRTLQKSFGVQEAGGAAKSLTKAEVTDLLLKSFENKQNDVTGMDVTRFETSGYIRPEVAARLGLTQPK